MLSLKSSEKETIFTALNGSSEKVMFSQVSACPQGGGGMPGSISLPGVGMPGPISLGGRFAWSYVSSGCRYVQEVWIYQEVGISGKAGIPGGGYTPRHGTWIPNPSADI